MDTFGDIFFFIFFILSIVLMWLRWTLTSDLEKRAPDLWEALGQPSGPREGNGRFVAFFLKGKFTSPPIPNDSIAYFYVLRWVLILWLIPLSMWLVGSAYSFIRLFI